MAVFVFLLVAAACVFFLYALVQFSLEEKAPAAKERNAAGISGDFFGTNRDAIEAAAQGAAQRFCRSTNAGCK